MALSQTKRKKQTIAIIGAGRLGTALGIALSNLDHKIVTVVSRKIARAKQAASLMGSDVSSLSFKQLSKLPACNIVFITTPDDAIAAVSKQLAENLASENKLDTVFHTSGALSSECLIDLKRKDVAVGSFHPLLSVSDPLIGAKGLGQAFYCVEGEREAVRIARQLVSDLGGSVFTIETKNKALYHASAVMACGHFVALFDMAIEMLIYCGLDEDEARRALLPLVRSAVDNLSANNPAQSLTGPFARADAATIKKHLEAFSQAKLDEALQTYILLGERSLELARQNGKDEDALKKIEEMLRKADER
jgi:predicted short-subunit dehydrogenase-like oxidoreductase (DUF2520 family)